MNYENEVKKIYPDAWAVNFTVNSGSYAIMKRCATDKRAGESILKNLFLQPTAYEAWKYTYNRLYKSGRIDWRTNNEF